MAEEFDPYHKWLGIPPSEQPPNYYRLLGIELFESDIDVIESAADQRMAHLRTFQGGKNAQLSQNLLNEVSKARICLLKPTSKKEYDESLGIPELPSADDSGAPPVQIQTPIMPGQRSPALMPIVVIIVLICLGGGALAYYKFFAKADQPDLAQADNAKAGNTEPEDGSEGQTPGGNSQSSSTQSKNKSTPENQTSDDSKSPGNANPKNGNQKDSQDNGSSKPANGTDDQQNSDSKKSDPQNSDPQNPSKMKDDAKTKNNDTDPKKKNDDEPTIIIGSKSNKKPAVVVRAPLPPAQRWKPFIKVLKDEFDIKDDLTRDSRHVLFNELVKNGADEVRPDRAYALFNIAMEQARLLNHVNGMQRYCLAFSERFEFELDDARVTYLTSIADGLASKPHVALLLTEIQKEIKSQELKSNFGAAANLIQSVLLLAESQVGRDIDQGHFEMWLLANQYRQKIMENLDEFKNLEKSNKLTPAQHRVLGTYYFFIESDHEAGLNHYAKSGYKPLVDLAKKASDLNVSNVNEIAEIADQWWTVSSKLENEEYLFKLRSGFWYQEYAKLVSLAEISKKILKRVEDLNVGIGLKRIPVVRSPSQVLMLDFESELAPVQVGEHAQIEFVNSNMIALLSKEDDVGSFESRMQVFRVDSKAELYNETSNDFVKHRIVSGQTGRFAWIYSREIMTLDATSLLPNGRSNSNAQRRFRSREGIRAFDIGQDGDVFALADKFVYWWNPQQAWGQNGSRTPTKLASPVAFIPDRIQIIPNSSYVAMSDTRNLVRVNLISKGVSELHSGSKLIDYDFAANGSGMVAGVESGIRYRAFKGSKNLIFPSGGVTKVRFLPNSRFFVSLHKDHSVRVWDVSEKNNDYLVARYDSVDFLPIDFAVAKDGSQIVMIDGSSRVKFFTLYYE